MTDAMTPPITMIGCYVHNPIPGAVPAVNPPGDPAILSYNEDEPKYAQVHIQPGGWIVPVQKDGIIVLGKGSRIRALDEGGFVIETIPDTPEGPVPAGESVPVTREDEAMSDRAAFLAARADEDETAATKPGAKLQAVLAGNGRFDSAWARC